MLKSLQSINYGGIVMTSKGKIVINPDWDLTERRKVALERLSELDVSVRSHNSKSDFLIEIPLRSAYSEYIEIGYLIAQLGDEDFPKGCETLTRNVPYSLLPGTEGKYPAVRFKESHPDYMQFVVTLAKDRKP
jgi:hypothetical protein